MSRHNNVLNAKVKKFCISLLESAGSFAYTRGVMGELDTSIRSWFISSLFPLFTMPVLLPWIVLLRAEEHTRVIFLWDFVHFRAEVERLGGNRTLIEVLDQLKDWEEDWVPVLQLWWSFLIRSPVIIVHLCWLNMVLTLLIDFTTLWWSCICAPLVFSCMPKNLILLLRINVTMSINLIGDQGYIWYGLCNQSFGVTAILMTCLSPVWGPQMRLFASSGSLIWFYVKSALCSQHLFGQVGRN